MGDGKECAYSKLMLTDTIANLVLFSCLKLFKRLSWCCIITEKLLHRNYQIILHNYCIVHRYCIEMLK